MRFFRNVFGTFLTEAVIVSLNLLTGVLTARALGPSQRGVLTLVMTLPVTLIALTDPGISQANIYFVGRKGHPPGQIAANSACLALCIGALAATALWLVRGLALDTVLRSMPASYFTLALCLTPLLLLHTYWLATLRAMQQFRLFNLLRLLTPVVLLLLMSAALAISGDGITWAVPAYGLALSISGAVSLAVMGWQIRPHLRPDWALMRQSLAYGIKSYLQDLISHLTYRLDVYMVALFLPPREVAFYGIATSIAEVVWYIPNSVGLVLFPKLSATHESSVHQVTAEVCRHTLIVTALASVVILGLGALAVPLLYGQDYTPVLRPLLFLVPGVIVMTLYKVLVRDFSSRDRQQVSIVAGGAGLVLNGALNWVLIPRLGTVGAAISSTLAYSAAGLVLLWAFQRESGLDWAAALRLRRSDLQRYRELLQFVRARLAGAGSRAGSGAGSGE